MKSVILSTQRKIKSRKIYLKHFPCLEMWLWTLTVRGRDKIWTQAPGTILCYLLSRVKITLVLNLFFPFSTPAADLC
jgi:hypothetical protein